MKMISVVEFNKRLLNFREKAFSRDATGEERFDAVMELIRSYLNVDQKDPAFTDAIAINFDAVMAEYATRLRMMGIPLDEVS